MLDLLPMALALELYNSYAPPKIQIEQYCHVENAVREAGNQGLVGMALIVEVTENRTRDNFRTDGTVCGTVWRDRQFSWTSKPKRKTTATEWNRAIQVTMSYLYGNPGRLLPLDTYSFINPDIATDLSWYDPDKVAMVWKDHHFQPGKF